MVDAERENFEDLETAISEPLLYLFWYARSGVLPHCSDFCPTYAQNLLDFSALNFFFGGGPRTPM